MELQTDGSYRQVEVPAGTERINCQERLLETYARRPSE